MEKAYPIGTGVMINDISYGEVKGYDIMGYSPILELIDYGEDDPLMRHIRINLLEVEGEIKKVQKDDKH